MNRMKAVRMHAYGGKEVLKYEDAPVPETDAAEMLVRVRGAGINPIDWKVREGHARDFLHFSLPFIPGWDIAGTVEKTGPDVTAFKPGDEIFAFVGLEQGGGYAEFAVIKEKEAAFKPQVLDFYQAAAVPLAALTAWQALFDLAQLEAGQKILIHAAAGGVGHFAVQFAAWRNAHVIGTASGANLDFLRGIGCHEMIDYQKTPFEKSISGVDVVLDLIGGETRQRSWPVLKKNGILVSTLPPVNKAEAQQFGVRGADILVQPSREQLGEIAELIDSGTIRPRVQEVLHFSDAAKAQELNKAGHTQGKRVLKVS